MKPASSKKVEVNSVKLGFTTSGLYSKEFIKSSPFNVEVCGKKVTTGGVISHQTYGDMLRLNPHWHCIILEGGLTDNNEFYHIQLKDIKNLTEIFRKAVIKLFVDKELINKDFAIQFSNWTHSGFSVDNSVFLFPYDDKAREGLCQYIARLPVSLQKITYMSIGGICLFCLGKFIFTVFSLPEIF